MNIHDQEETSILCRRGAEKGDKYFVRTDVKINITELLRKIPRYLEHLFDFLPSNLTNNISPRRTFPFCCRLCKKKFKKQQRLVDSITTVENDLHSRWFLDGKVVQKTPFLEKKLQRMRLANYLVVQCRHPGKINLSVANLRLRLANLPLELLQFWNKMISAHKTKKKEDTKEKPNKELGVNVSLR